MSNKTLIFVFFILFIVFVGEVSYLFYFSKSKPPIAQDKFIPIISQSPVNSVPEQPERSGIQAIKDDVLKYLSTANSGVLKSSILTNRYEGKIIELVNTMNDPTTDHGLKIKFKGENEAVNGFFYNKDEVVNKISFYNYPLKKITMDALKVGDLISLDEELNLLNDNDLNNLLIKVTITVLK